MRKKEVAAIAIPVLIAVGILGYVEFRPESQELVQDAPASVISYTLSIENVAPSAPMRVPEGTTALNALKLAAQSSNFEIREKEYSGLGTLVEKIGAFENGTDGNYWQYYVNGELAAVGADQYVAQNGDIVEWKFAVPELY